MTKAKTISTPQDAQPTGRGDFHFFYRAAIRDEETGEVCGLYVAEERHFETLPEAESHLDGIAVTGGITDPEGDYLEILTKDGASPYLDRDDLQTIPENAHAPF